MFSYVSEFFSDPINTLIIFLLAFPGRVLALSMHEFAHAWVANRCGDPTARLMGRMTINPIKHLDVMGTIMMLVFGIGWAKPVPVNPRNFRNYRKDDLKVALAGVTMNFLMFLLGMLLLFIIIAFTLTRIPLLTLTSAAEPDFFRMVQDGVTNIYWRSGDMYYYTSLLDILQMAPFASKVLIEPMYGALAGHLYQMLGYFVMTNISLMIFNLLPIPPLDGYHVLNDLVLRRDLFANQRTAMICQAFLFILAFSGKLSEGLSWVITKVFMGTGNLAAMVMRIIGLMQ